MDEQERRRIMKEEGLMQCPLTDSQRQYIRELQDFFIPRKAQDTCSLPDRSTPRLERRYER